MELFELTDETWLDLTVNFIPVGILIGMEVLFILFNPWGWDPWFVFWMHFLTLFPLVLLVLLTYVSGRVVQRDERRAAGELSDEESGAD